MSLMQRHDEVVAEINRYYAFKSRIQFRIQVRLLISPKLLWRCMWFLVPRRGRNISKQRQEVIDVLCNSAEKDSPFYSICLHGYPTDALGEYLENGFRDSDWLALIDVHGVRERAIPRYRFSKRVLPWLPVLIPILAIFRNPSEDAAMSTSFLQWMHPMSWVNEPLVFFIALTVPYTVLLVLGSSLSLARARYRLRRAGNMLAYMAFRQRARQRRASSA